MIKSEVELDILKEFIDRRRDKDNNINLEEFLYAIEDYKMDLLRRDRESKNKK